MKDFKKIPFEQLLEMYADYRNSNIWEHPGGFKDTFTYVQYGMVLKLELQRRDRKGSTIL